MPANEDTIPGLSPEPQPPKDMGFSPLDSDNWKEYRKDHAAWRRERDALLAHQEQQETTAAD